MKNVQKVSLQGHLTRGVISISSKFAIALAIMVGLMAGPISAKAEDHVTQLSYLQSLVKISGDSAQFNNSSTAQDYVQWALAKGMTPNGGWKPDKVLTKQALAQTLAQMLGLVSKKGGDPVRDLAREGITLDGAPDDITRNALLSLLASEPVIYRIPGTHSPHKPPNPHKPPHPHNNGNGNG